MNQESSARLDGWQLANRPTLREVRLVGDANRRYIHSAPIEAKPVEVGPRKPRKVRAGSVALRP